VSCLRVVIIGAGHLGTIHTRLLLQHPDVECIGVADPDPAARRRAEQAFRLPTAADYRPWLAEMDAAIIAAPSQEHYDIAVDLLGRGIHLLIEKPLTTATWQADQLVSLAQQQKSIVQVGHVERFNPAWNAVCNRIGRPTLIEAIRHSGYTFRSTDIGVVFDLMIHDLDLILSLVGSSVSEIQAFGATILSRDEDFAQARLQFSCGTVASFSASRCSPTATRIVRLFGPQGFATIDLANHSAEIIEISPAAAGLRQVGEQLSADQKQKYRDELFSLVLPRSTLTVEPCNAIFEEQKDWLESIRLGHAPRVGIEAGQRAVALAEWITQEIKRRQAVPADTVEADEPIILPFRRAA
jgi:predicted dehydrogenase